MLTAEQRKLYETAARLYCQRIGENPDERIPMPDPKIPGVQLPGRMWWLGAEKIHDMSMLLTSMKDAALAKEATAAATTTPGANDA